MFNVEKKYDLILFVIIIDLYLLIILYTQDLTSYDMYLGYVIFVSHIFFIINLTNNNEKMIDILHVWYMIYTGILGVFIKNKHLVMFYLITMAFMLYFWYYDNKCPLGNFDTLPSVNKFINISDELNGFAYGTTFMVLLLVNKLFNFVNIDAFKNWILGKPLHEEILEKNIEVEILENI